jgi:hypothetical protein
VENCGGECLCSLAFGGDDLNYDNEQKKLWIQKLKSGKIVFILK